MVGWGIALAIRLGFVSEERLLHPPAGPFASSRGAAWMRGKAGSYRFLPERRKRR
jgi:hypothetical protein